MPAPSADGPEPAAAAAGWDADVDIEQQDWVQGFLQKTHAALEEALRKAAKDALNEVAAKALLLVECVGQFGFWCHFSVLLNDRFTNRVSLRLAT